VARLSLNLNRVKSPHSVFLLSQRSESFLPRLNLGLEIQHGCAACESIRRACTSSGNCMRSAGSLNPMQRGSLFPSTRPQPPLRHMLRVGRSPRAKVALDCSLLPTPPRTYVIPFEPCNLDGVHPVRRAVLASPLVRTASHCCEQQSLRTAEAASVTTKTTARLTIHIGRRKKG